MIRLFPWQRLNGTYALLLTEVGRQGKADATFLCQDRNGLEEIEDATLKWMEDAKSDQLAKNIDKVLTFGCGSNPVEPLVCHNRIGCETLGDVLREIDVTQQKFETWIARTMVDVMWRLPAEHLLGTFCEDTLEAHRSHLRADVVVVDE